MRTGFIARWIAFIRYTVALLLLLQVALFVAPVLVLASLWVGPAPMDLAFSGGLVLTVLLAVLITEQMAGDGRSDWLKGVQLLAVYLISGLAFFFIPGAPHLELVITCLI